MAMMHRRLGMIALAALTLWLPCSADVNEPNDDLLTATPISCGTTVENLMIDAGDVDFFRIEVVAPTRLVIDIDAFDLGSSLDSLLGLFDAAGTLGATSDNDPAPGESFITSDSYLDPLIPIATPLFIAVGSTGDGGFDGTGGTTQGSYTLSIRCLPASCVGDADCADGNACNGAERCVDQTCQPAPPPLCNDGNSCTTDSCDPVSGCQTVNLDQVPCDDGNECTLGDTCQQGSCIPIDVVDCDDGIPCTEDFECQPGFGCLNIETEDSDGDGFCDAADNCAPVANPAQNPVPFQQTILAATPQVWVWNDPISVIVAYGELGNLPSFTLLGQSPRFNATQAPLFDVPPLGSAYWLLVAVNCDANSWTSGGSSEAAGRDSSPLP